MGASGAAYYERVLRQGPVSLGGQPTRSSNGKVGERRGASEAKGTTTVHSSVHQRRPNIPLRDDVADGVLPARSEDLTIPNGHIWPRPAGLSVPGGGKGTWVPPVLPATVLAWLALGPLASGNGPKVILLSDMRTSTSGCRRPLMIAAISMRQEETVAAGSRFTQPGIVMWSRPSVARGGGVNGGGLSGGGRRRGGD